MKPERTVQGKKKILILVTVDCVLQLTVLTGLEGTKNVSTRLPRTPQVAIYHLSLGYPYCDISFVKRQGAFSLYESY